jgi:hypothetical protein
MVAYGKFVHFVSELRRRTNQVAKPFEFSKHGQAPVLRIEPAAGSVPREPGVWKRV